MAWERPPVDVVPSSRPRPGTGSMVRVPGGVFLMGDDREEAFSSDGEGPVREVELRPFLMDVTAVTNAQFTEFIANTGYVTDAERYGWSFVFAAFVTGEAAAHVLSAHVPGTPWWVPVRGVTWRNPEGSGSVIEERMDHPVVHVSWHDARAYAQWAGKRLPTEAEWERAARGGLERARFPWGNELEPGGTHRCNIWQGDFPHHNTGADGHLGTAPVSAYEPNGLGIHNAAGNTWEWCADWWSTTWHRPEVEATRVDPLGPAEGSEKVMRGGSYLCHLSYCTRYRVSARTANTPDSSTGHMSFRCATDLSIPD